MKLKELKPLDIFLVWLTSGMTVKEIATLEEMPEHELQALINEGRKEHRDYIKDRVKQMKSL